MSTKIKRVYSPVEKSDGVRILVDRLWPRGISKDNARVDEWVKDVAPSDALRKWFGHNPERWEEFRRRYKIELADPDKKALVGRLRTLSRKGTVTFIYAAKDEVHNNANVVAEVVERKLNSRNVN